MMKFPSLSAEVILTTRDAAIHDFFLQNDDTSVSVKIQNSTIPFSHYAKTNSSVTKKLKIINNKENYGLPTSQSLWTIVC